MLLALARWSMTDKKFDASDNTLSSDNCFKGQSIDFSIDPSGLFYISRYIRPMDDVTVVSDYRNFIKSDLWHKNLNEFADVRDPTVLRFGEKGLMKLGKLFEELYQTHQIDELYTAIYAPNPLPFGLARMYQAFTEENAEVSQIFRDYSLAREWLIRNCRHT